jgi:excinuclease ABC subunit B
MAEELTKYLQEQGIRVQYLHSDVDTIRRVELLRELRLGEFDVLVGINLLREGLDLPEVSLVAILDADKEGFLRSETSLIQTIGRAARNVSGEVHMYADRITDSMKRAIGETNRRREKQIKFNEDNGITPEPIRKKISDITDMLAREDADTRDFKLEQSKRGLKSKNQGLLLENLSLAEFEGNTESLIDELSARMHAAAEGLQFEVAARYRDEIRELKRELRSISDR